MAKKSTLRELLITKLQALYDVEQELVSALPKMVEKASDPELQSALDEHLDETKEHVERLEEAFDLLDEEAEGLKGDAIRGLVKDSQWIAKNTEDGDARDAGIIATARYVEHYEMAGYMVAAEWAKALEEEDVAAILEDTLEEEEAADEKLSELGNLIAERLNVEEDEEE